MAKKQEPGKAIVKWEEELAALAEGQSAVSAKAEGRNYLSFKQGRLSYQGDEIQDGVIQCYILDFIYENRYYTADYDPDEPSSPVCYAFDRNEETLAPHDECEEKQSDACEGCPMNEWGSADKGEGKACANIIRLALIPVGTPDEIATSEVAYAIISKTNKKAWDKYYKALVKADPKKPIWYWQTEITVKPDPKRQVDVSYTTCGKIEDGETFAALKKKREQLGDEIMHTYPKNEERPEPKPKKTSKFAGKKR